MKFSVLAISLTALTTSIHAAPTVNADPIEAAALIPRGSLCGFAASLQTRACKRSEPVDDVYISGPCSWSEPEGRKRNPACREKRSEPVDNVYISGPCSWSEKKARSDEIMERIPEAFGGLKMSKKDLGFFAEKLEERSAEC